jgi:hypothetical protein
MKRILSIVLVNLFSLAITAGNALAQGCAMCKENAAGAGEQVANGFNYAILAMVFLPATLVSGVSIFVIRANYRKRHPETTFSTPRILFESIKEWRASRNS